MKDEINPVKILVIDDEAYIRESIKGFLQDYNYEVIEAENGRKGLEYFEQESPDLILCDLRMPEMDGLEILEIIVNKSPNTPIIIVSGAGNIADSVEALRIGAWDYIIKPVQDMAVLLHAIENALEKSSLIKEKEFYRKDLEAVNARLLHSLDTLEKTKDKLVQSEKMAALGGLVAGVAHEINTPVGIGITAASFLRDRTQNITELYLSGNLKKSDLEPYLKNMDEVSLSILINMERAATLIKSFKQIAVDQTFEDKRRFNFKLYLQDVLISLKPVYRDKGCTIELNCSNDIEIFSYPGAYSQIISNLLLNSIIHGFKDKRGGKISFDIKLNGGVNGELNGGANGEFNAGVNAEFNAGANAEFNAGANAEFNAGVNAEFNGGLKNDLNRKYLIIDYRDNGIGMTQEQVSKVFDPFYTTMRGQGGTGLGMSIVFNIITQTLKGTIDCSSVPGIETKFLIVVPVVPVVHVAPVVPV